MRIQLQLYNMWDQVQFTQMNATYTFSATGNTAANTGKYTQTTNPLNVGLTLGSTSNSRTGPARRRAGPVRDSPRQLPTLQLPREAVRGNWVKVGRSGLSAVFTQLVRADPFGSWELEVGSSVC